MRGRIYHIIFIIICSGKVFQYTSFSTEKQWYRGNTHTHSLWSDGNEFPEMILEWYKNRDYNFIAISDHDILPNHEKWISVAEVLKRQKGVGPTAIKKYYERFSGTNWIERRNRGGVDEIRLKMLSEYRGFVEEPGEFLVIQAQEISAGFDGKPIHINAINIQDLLMPVEGESVRDVMRKNLRAIQNQERVVGKPILTHLNHPNYKWAITAEDLGYTVEERFFEVYNGHPEINHLGDDNRPGDEVIWDVANMIRLRELNVPPLFAVATDDSHNYHGGKNSPGRGWIMVRAHELDSESIIQAMREGDFYASTGVYLRDISWDKYQRDLHVKIEPEGDSTFTTELFGVRKSSGVSLIRTFADEVEVIARRTGEDITFEVPEDVFYARVTVTSNREPDNPSFSGQKRQAWIQPVAWELIEAKAKH